MDVAWAAEPCDHSLPIRRRWRGSRAERVMARIVGQCRPHRDLPDRRLEPEAALSIARQRQRIAEKYPVGPRALVHRRRTVRAGRAIPSTTWRWRARLSRSPCAPAGHIHPIPTDHSQSRSPAPRPTRASCNPSTALRASIRTRPLFDLVLMGAGPDGHTASLFPGYPASRRQERWVVGVPKANVAPFVPRVSLTLPVLASCREMLFEIAGHDKQPILTRLLNGETLPATRARSQGETVWLVDQAALPEDFRGPR